MSTQMSATGKRVLVLGGSGAIGGAIARGFAEYGASVAIAGRDGERLDGICENLTAAELDVFSFTANVRDTAALHNLVSDAADRLGGLDVLINSQGTTIIKPAIETSEEDYDLVVDTNMKSVFFACMAAYPYLKQSSGSVINIASLAAHRGWPKACTYGMSKFAVLGLTRSLAAEWAPDGIRVNSISPGFFMTALTQDRMGEARKQAALSRTPFNRFGEVEELVGAALYLASSEAGFVSGTDINVDGGYLAAGI